MFQIILKSLTLFGVTLRKRMKLNHMRAENLVSRACYVAFADLSKAALIFHYSGLTCSLVH